MKMSLTKTDLQAIGDLIEPKFEELAIGIAQGFEEVHKKFDGAETRLSRKIKNLTIRQIEILGYLEQHKKRITTLEAA